MNEELKEGWQGKKHQSQRVYHYMVASRSLCDKLGFYFDELEAAKEGQAKRDDDCAACYRKLQIRLKKNPPRTA